MSPEDRAEALALIAVLDGRTANAAEHEQVAAAFEADMRPVAVAVVDALREGDTDALRGLRAMLPGLLGTALGNGALEEEMCRMIGQEVAKGLTRRHEGTKGIAGSNDYRDFKTGRYTFAPDHGGGAGGGAGKWSAPEATSLKNFFFRLKNDPNANIQARIGELHPRVVGRIHKALGQAVNEVWIHADEYRHVMAHHSKEISQADWAALPTMILSAQVILPTKTEKGEPAVEIWKKEAVWKLVIGTGREGTQRLYVRTFKNRRERE